LNAKIKSAKTILVRCPNWVGDIVMATPVYDCLRENFPSARIFACIRKYARGIIEDGPWFDGIISCNDKDFHGFFRTVKEIRKIMPDIAVLLPNSTRSFLTAKFGGARSIYGYRRNIRKFFMSGGPEPIVTGGKIKPIPMIHYYLEICRHMGLSVSEAPKPRLYISSEMRKRGNRILRAYGVSRGDRLIGLNPGASFGSSKCWPPENFAKLSEIIQKEFDCKIILFAGPGEEKIARAIIEKSRAKIIDTSLDNIDLAHLKPLIDRCDLLITNDTGPRHYAVAFDVPVVVLMGPTDPRYTNANLERTIIIREEISCAPCHKKTCPADHRCMRNITPERVLDAVGRLLK